jgi:4-hydroxy-tetrahydrodipicolinate reductase
MAGNRRVAVVGALGRMGERVRAALADEAGCELGAALEAPGHPGLGRQLEAGIAVSDDPKAVLPACDLAIVFATPAASLELLRTAAEIGVGCVVGTTGFSPEERAEIEQIATRIPVVLAPNFSVAVNVLAHLVGRASALLGPEFDAEIVELHHAAKRDAPSGTALWLSEAVAAARTPAHPEPPILAREGEIGPRPAGAIAIQTLRGGDNPGEHTVFFIGRGERLELTHRSATRDHFARGALRAALWLADRPAGLYSMTDVLGLGD